MFQYGVLVQNAWALAIDAPHASQPMWMLIPDHAAAGGAASGSGASGARENAPARSAAFAASHRRRARGRGDLWRIRLPPGGVAAISPEDGVSSAVTRPRATRVSKTDRARH